MQGFQDVFISYGRKDSLAFADQLNRRLVALGFVVWFDFDDIPVGVDYQKQIDDGIERSDNFVFVISPHAINSPYCLKEIELALKRNKRIIPVMHVERVSQETWQIRNPDGTEAQWQDYQARGLHDHFQNMHPEVRKINWIYMREGVDDFEVAFTKLLGLFDQHKDYVNRHTMLLSQALEWERQQRRSQYLLVGEERLQAVAWLKTRFQDSQPPCLPTDLHCELITESLKNAENLMTQVFLAYADADRETAQKVRYSLMREGFTVWINTHDIGTGMDFQNAINQGIEEADNFVYLMSPAAVQSDYCQRELEYSMSLHKRIVPILAAAVEPSQIPAALRNLQYIDLTNNLLETDYQQDESQLLRVLRENAAYHADHKVLLAKALKWQRQQQNPTFLLRGYNLRHTEAWLKLAQQTPACPPTAVQEEFIAASLRQPPGVSLDVFISYSRVDSGIARQLNDRLQVQGKRTWFDQESIAAGTADFQAEIHRGIESADHFLFILSPNSVSSPYCADEVEYAAKLNKRFVTILHRSIDTATLHPELAKVQWLDFSHPDRDDSANFQVLLRVLETDAEHLQVHTRLLVKAIEWDSRGRNDSFLLRGDDLDEAADWLVQGEAKQPPPTDLHRAYISTSRTVEQAQAILLKAGQTAKRRIQIGSGVMGVMLVIAAVGALLAQQRMQEADRQIADAKQITQIEQGSIAALRQLETQPVRALVSALEAGQQLQTLVQQKARTKGATLVNQKLALAEYPAYSPIDSLHQILSTIQTHEIPTRQKFVSSVSWSPDGQTLATGGFDGSVNLWSRTGEAVKTLNAQQSIVFSVNWSPDGQTLATGGGDDTVTLWSRTGEAVKTLKAQQGSVSSANWSPDGQTLATGGFDGTVKLWSRTGEPMKTINAQQRSVKSVSWSPDGQTLATGGDDGTVKIWSHTGEAVKTLNAHKGSVNSVSWSPVRGASPQELGQTLVTGGDDGTVKLWSRTGELVKTIKTQQGSVTSVSWSSVRGASPQELGQTLATGGDDGTVKLWSRTGELVKTLNAQQSSVSWSPDGQTLAIGSVGTVKLWSRTGEAVKTINAQQRSVTSMSWSPVRGASPQELGQTLATGGDDGTVKLWSRTGKAVKTINAQYRRVSSVSWSPDGQTLAIGGDDGSVKLWSRTGEVVKTLNAQQSSVSWSPDGQTLATGGFDGTVKLWSRTGKVVKTLNAHAQQATSLSWSPLSKASPQELEPILATGGLDGTVKLWTRTGEPVKTLNAQQSLLSSMSWSPDGQTLATGGYDGTVKLWTRTGEPVKMLNVQQGIVYSVSWSPDGQTLATNGADGTVKLWSRTGELVKTLNAQQSFVYSVSWSPDGQTLATGGADGTVKLWPTEDLDALLVKGCRWASSYLIGTPQALQKLTICQTPERLHAAAPNLIADSEAQARAGDLEAAIQGFTTAQQWDPSLAFDPVTRATANQRQGEADRLLKDKHPDRALTKLNEALSLQPDLAIPADTWNSICWDGSLNGQAALVLPACHKAVTLRPNDGDIRESRGLARALTGDKPGAIQDFQFFVSQTADAKLKAQVQGWIKALQAGKPPSAIFTPKVLEQLRNP